MTSAYITNNLLVSVIIADFLSSIVIKKRFKTSSNTKNIIVTFISIITTIYEKLFIDLATSLATKVA
jgi:hypothetical protein